MDIVLGVSMTPVTVRMVLVEGEKGDGATVDHDVFDVSGSDGSATSGAAAQVVDAVLGTKESAEAGGHDLKAIGVTWSDHAEASQLRDALAARDIDDVMLVSEGHAAAALAQAVGRAVGYDTTALLFIDRDTATLSVVQTDDGSVVKVLSSSLHSQDAMAVLADMAAAVDAQDDPPQGMFVVGSGVDVSSVRSHLEHLVSLPMRAPDEPDMALARGAALAAANAPAMEASTVGLAYSQDPDGTTAGSVYAGLAAAETQLAPVGGDGAYSGGDESGTGLSPAAGDDRKPFLLVGSAMASIFVVGVVALVISLAVSIRPTADQRPSPGQSAIVPSTVAPAPPPAPAQQAQPAQAPPPPPQAETIKAPVPVVQQQPAPQAPRTVYVESPPPAPAAPAPAAPPPAPAPVAPPPAPAPVAPAPVVPAPVPVYVPPVVAPPQYYPRPQNPWNPPWSPPRSVWTPPKPQKPPKWTPPWQNGTGGFPGGSDDYPYPGGSVGQYPGSGPSDSGSRGRGGSSGRGGVSICVLNICAGG
ncbi:hypothetical protein [Mycobacterium sp. 1164985.4]|uniref:DUF7159 family protein n=1 Tax=Mycobacterium sp. 1164985.4 TaxID=1834069 RepID=UPI0007FC1C0F|nr:hypothetical protein [Mycobacterium sp. 1164985.4]OBK82615.1 hypothetical protein A5650_23080 [Mycobacterium sp. 1164985.4]